MNSEELTEKLTGSIGEAVTSLPEATLRALEGAKEREEGGAKVQIEAMLEAVEAGGEQDVPICQDTGIPTFFVRIGKSFPGLDELGRLKYSLTEAVRRATDEVPLRPNTIHPITEENAGDNTGNYIPYIDWRMVEGEEILINYLPKGGGSENMCQLTMMTPGRGLKGVKEIVLERVASMEGKPCPPTVLGVGLGGGSNICMDIAKKSLLRPVGERHENSEVASLEKELLDKCNELGIGPMGVGGKTTVLDVHVDYAHRHPASYPVGIVVQCWCNRRASLKVGPDGSVEVMD